MNIRKYKSNDCEEIVKLFYYTVHTINAKDYTKEQLNVWATGKVDTDAWDKSFLEHFTIVAVENDEIIGFGDIDDSGYVDRLYVHKDHQGKKVATKVLKELENHAVLNNAKKLTTHASITAKPFFEKRGYSTIKENIVTRSGVKLTNFIMEKYIKQI